VIVEPPKHIEFQWPDLMVDFTCAATTDVASILTYTWTHDGNAINDGKVNITFSDDTSHVSIDLSKLTEEQARLYLGVWTCNASNGVSFDSEDAKLHLPGELKGAGVWWWWIILLVVFVLLLIIIFILFIRLNKGDEYPVDQKERRGGNDPEKELIDTGFQDYKRQAASSEQPLISRD